MNSPWHEIRWEVGRQAEGSLQDSQPPAFAAAGRHRPGGEAGFGGGSRIPAEFGKSVGPPWKKAGDTVIQVRSSRKFQGHRKSQGVLVCQAQGEDPWDRGRESPGAGPAGVTQENEEAEMVEKGRAVIWGT